MRLPHRKDRHTFFHKKPASLRRATTPRLGLGQWLRQRRAMRNYGGHKRRSAGKAFASLLVAVIRVGLRLPLWARLAGPIAIAALAVWLVWPKNPPSQASFAMQAATVAGEQAAALIAPEITASESEPAPMPTPTPDITLKQGDDNERVLELQSRLMELRYLDLDEPTQYFGPATDYAVQLFQRQHGLQVDGIAGASTQEMIFSDDAKPYTLMEGAKGSDVEGFQRRLKQLGYLKTADGQYGKATVKAVQDFQKRNNLRIDGKAGEQTFDMIYSPNAKGPVPTAYGTGGSVDKLITAAKAALGKRYVLGNEGPNSYDCSGLVYACLIKAGVKTGRLNAAGFSQVDKWKKISYGSIRRGDLLFFSTNGKRVGHTGIYLGGGEMIDASSANGKVVRRACNTAFWKRNFVCARRPW